MQEILTSSAEETEAVGRALGRVLPANSVLLLMGDLGSGKTTFVRGFLAGAGLSEMSEVVSPTFSYLNIYTARLSVYHFDLYRLPHAEAFFSAGFDEYLQAGGICCIEWPERAPQQLGTIDIQGILTIQGDGRLLRLIASTDTGEKIIAYLAGKQ